MTTINEEEAAQANQKSNESGDDIDRAEAPKVEVGELGEGEGDDGDGEKPE